MTHQETKMNKIVILIIFCDIISLLADITLSRTVVDTYS